MSARSALSERLLFLRSFVAHPRQVGAILPTSRRAVEVMLHLAELERADLVLELGAGTGSHTRAILARLGPQARLVAFEIDPRMAEAVRDAVSDPRLEVVAGSAEDMHGVLDGASPQVVVSALPFTSLPSGVGRAILERTADVLAPDGVFLVLQYSPLIASQLSQLFGSVQRRVCLRNVPPAFLFACREPRRSGGGSGSATAGGPGP